MLLLFIIATVPLNQVAIILVVQLNYFHLFSQIQDVNQMIHILGRGNA